MADHVGLLKLGLWSVGKGEPGWVWAGAGSGGGGDRVGPGEKKMKRKQPLCTVRLSVCLLN